MLNTSGYLFSALYGYYFNFITECAHHSTFLFTELYRLLVSVYCYSTYSYECTCAFVCL